VMAIMTVLGHLHIAWMVDFALHWRGLSYSFCLYKTLLSSSRRKALLQQRGIDTIRDITLPDSLSLLALFGVSEEWHVLPLTCSMIKKTS
jgi:hypothetical protein